MSSTKRIMGQLLFLAIFALCMANFFAFGT